MGYFVFHILNRKSNDNPIIIIIHGIWHTYVMFFGEFEILFIYNIKSFHLQLCILIIKKITAIKWTTKQLPIRITNGIKKSFRFQSVIHCITRCCRKPGHIE